MIDEYRSAGIHPRKVWPQSFNYDDVIYWVNNTVYGEQAVYLDGRSHANTSRRTMESWVADGVQVLAPPIWMLLDVDSSGEIIPSQYAINANAAGLKLIAWSLERSGRLTDNGGWYYQSINGDDGGRDAIEKDGDVMTVLDVLAQDVGVIGVFSDWPATTTYYANCMRL